MGLNTSHMVTWLWNLRGPSFPSLVSAVNCPLMFTRSELTNSGSAITNELVTYRRLIECCVNKFRWSYTFKRRTSKEQGVLNWGKAIIWWGQRTYSLSSSFSMQAEKLLLIEESKLNKWQFWICMGSFHTVVIDEIYVTQYFTHDLMIHPRWAGSLPPNFWMTDNIFISVPN